MKVLIGIASHEIQHVESLRSCYLMECEPYDELDDKWKNRGDIAREAILERILGDVSYGPDDALLLLDADQKVPQDLLKRLRAHDMDMVCAHYYARDAENIQSMCFEIGDGQWPFHPYKEPPKEGLHQIALTGFGSVLIKKKVLQAVRDETPAGKRTMGTDFLFFYWAYLLGFKLWLDADLESKHAVTLWLDHETAERLKDD